MKAKTLLELVTLSASLYSFSQNEEMMNRLKEMTEKGKDRINRAVNDPVLDEHGEEMEFVDKMIHKAAQAKDELEQKIEDMVAQFYQKVNIAHTDEINALHKKLEDSDKTIALLEARLNQIESKA
jgi:polyhydroxyalkanoate synthesis regulator phasin